MAAIILAGGESSRMKGANKPLMEFKGQTMIGYLIDKLRVIFSDIIIAAKDAELYTEYSAQIAVDSFEHQGPLSGIHAGLKLSSTQKNFVVGCDMPLLNLDLVKYMLNRARADIVVPKVGNYFEPLHAIYNQNCVPEIEKVIEQNRFKTTSFWSNVSVQYIEETEIKKIDPHLYSFLNINTKKDHERALEIAENLSVEEDMPWEKRKNNI